jgi:hypothetical protein
MGVILPIPKKVLETQEMMIRDTRGIRKSLAMEGMKRLTGYVAGD